MKRIAFYIVFISVFFSGMGLIAVDVGDIALIEDTDGKIMEVIALPDQYLSRVACIFYRTHPDIYQAIFVFSDIKLNFITNTQQGWPVQSISRGIGRELPNGDLYNQTAKFCSINGNLRQAVKMGDISILPDDPDSPYKGIMFYALSGIELMGHEFGHQWLVNIWAKTVDGKKYCAMKGYEPPNEPKQGDCEWNTGWEDYNQHWSYYFNSDASLMYGSRIKDLGNGQFEISYDHPKYSELDQYLMGLRTVDEVDNSKLFYVDNGNGNSGSASLPIQPGKKEIISGRRVDFTMNDIIRAMGERIPQKEPCHLKGAFIIVYEAGKPPSQSTIDKVDRYRRRWETFYDYATDHRGSFDTTIDGRGTGTSTCPGKPANVDAGFQDIQMDVQVEDSTGKDIYYNDALDFEIYDTVETNDVIIVDDYIDRDTTVDTPLDTFTVDTCCNVEDVIQDTASEDIVIEEDAGTLDDVKRPRSDLNSLSDDDSSGCSCSGIL